MVNWFNYFVKDPEIRYLLILYKDFQGGKIQFLKIFDDYLPLQSYCLIRFPLSACLRHELTSFTSESTNN